MINLRGEFLKIKSFSKGYPATYNGGIMSLSDYVPIGKILTSNKGKKHEAILTHKGMTCRVCSFYPHKSACPKVKCNELERKDKNNVIFLRRKDLETKK